MSALAARGVEAAGDSGLGVWVPLADEAAAVRELLVQGWAVSPGERYRFRSAPGIRVTTASLEPDEAERARRCDRRARTRLEQHLRRLSHAPQRSASSRYVVP